MRDLVAVDLPNGPDFVEVLRRCWDNGDAFLPVDPRLPGPARAALFAAVRPTWVVDAVGKHQLPHGVPIDDGDAIVVATSGTTGHPKGVVLTHRAIEASATRTNSRLRVDPERDKWYACLPFAHIGGLSVVLRSIVGGVAFTATNRMESSDLFDALGAGHTLVSLVVATLHRTDPARWRNIVVGGSAIPEGLSGNIVRTYGMTETGSGVVYNGLPLADVAISFDSNQQILLKTPTLARGYRVDGETVPLPNIDGWFPTGDVGSLAADGTLRVVGRSGDVIVTGGEKVWPDDVERTLATCPGVKEVAVCAAVDPTWGHAVRAIVVAEADVSLTLAELRNHVKLSLPAYCAPQQLVFVDRLPRTPLGKLKRSELANLRGPLLVKRGKGPDAT